MSYTFIKPAATAALATLVLGTAASSGAFAQDRFDIGRLECKVEGGIGMIIGSSKEAVCSYYDVDSSEPVEVYYGKINKLGLDIGVTNESTIQWVVLAPKADIYSSGALAGEYVGVSAEATVGAGVGGNVLVGGSSKSFTLQPLSVQGQTGLNLAVGVTGFQLRAAE